MSNLVTIAKTGEKNLQILESTLAEHIRLGWEKVEEEVEAVIEKATGKSAGKATSKSAE